MPVKIMIADDSQVIRGILRALVQANSEWEICGEADDGQAAVAKAKALNPDLIILDLEMPLMDGLTAARLISHALPGTPIILHTMHDTPDIELEAMKNGITKVLPKSKSADLVPTIQGILAGKCPPNATSSGATMTDGLPKAS